MSENERKPLPPYMPYKSFGTFLDHLRAIGMPSHIDKTVMSSMSGGMQSWLKSALRYMNLITADDEPTPELERLVAAQGDERKMLLRPLFQRTYGFLNGKIDLKNTTPLKLREAVIAEGAQGETVEKIIAFMVAMAKEAGVPLTPLLTKRAPARRRPRVKAPTRGGVPEHDDNEDDAGEDDDAPESAAMKTIALPKSGGTLTLSGNINLFTLIGKERELVFKLIDAMNAFEAEEGGGDGS